MRGFCISTLAFEGANENLTSTADQKFNVLPEAADNEEKCFLNGVRGGESVHRVFVKRRIKKLQDACGRKELKVTANIVEAVELSRSCFICQALHRMLFRRHKFCFSEWESLPSRLLDWKK